MAHKEPRKCYLFKHVERKLFLLRSSEGIVILFKKKTVLKNKLVLSSKGLDENYCDGEGG